MTRGNSVCVATCDTASQSVSRLATHCHCVCRDLWRVITGCVATCALGLHTLIRASWIYRSFTVPTNEHFSRKNIVTYCSYMFLLHLSHYQGILHQNLRFQNTVDYMWYLCVMKFTQKDEVTFYEEVTSRSTVTRGIENRRKTSMLVRKENNKNIWTQNFLSLINKNTKKISFLPF